MIYASKNRLPIIDKTIKEKITPTKLPIILSIIKIKIAKITKK